MFYKFYLNGNRCWIYLYYVIICNNMMSLCFLGFYSYSEKSCSYLFWWFGCYFIWKEKKEWLFCFYNKYYIYLKVNK